MIKKEMEDLLNKQFHMEMHSAMQYLAISSYFEEENLDGFAHFFRVQATEEMNHAMKQFDYLHQVDGKITMESIPKPQVKFESFEAAFAFTLKQEIEVAEHINKLMKAASDLGDFATQTFLQWFVTEQVEEVDTARKILQKLKMIQDNTSALYLLNEEMKARKPEPGSDGGAL